MSRRARRWQSAADSHYYQAGPDQEPVVDYCFDCHEAIHATDDDACVCIDCGGRNRRFDLWPQELAEQRGQQR